jgi:hypothetical protein
MNGLGDLFGSRLLVGHDVCLLIPAIDEPPSDSEALMHPHPSITLTGALLLVSAVIQLPASADDGPVVIDLANGRRVQAVIDPRTDADRLWLATALDHGTISQSIPWGDVRHVEIAGHSYEGPVVQAAVATICKSRAPRPARLALAQHATRLDSNSLRLGAQPPERADRLPVARMSRVGTSRVGAPKIEAMSVSAQLGNWDRDVLIDGLHVEITPYDSSGRPIPCDGTVEILLRAWKASGRNGRTGMRSERWTVSVDASDFVSGSVFLQLPFRALRPQVGSDWWPYGALQVRLVTPGSGVIERTLSDLRLRPFEPTRDMFEQRTGRRFFPGENVQHHAWSSRRD